MKRKATTPSKPMQALRRLAMQYPEVQEGTSCTKAAFKAKTKSFLFLGSDDDSYNAMLKLGDSLAEAETLEAKHADRYNVGLHGWVTVTFPHTESPPPGLLERWLDESFRLLAPKKLVQMLPDSGRPHAVRPTKSVAKKAVRKKAAKKGR